MNFMVVPSYDGHMASPYILEIHCLSTFFDTIRPVHFKQIYIYISKWPLLFKHCATSLKVAGSIPDVSWEFFIDIILPAALWPWDRLSL
jgi:hypothetical protein